MSSTYRPMPDCLTIKSSDIDGVGVFAKEDIPKDTNLGVTHITDDRFLDGLARVDFGGFYNHSENPNCKSIITDEFYNLITIKDIKKGDEITATYNLYDPTLTT